MSNKKVSKAFLPIIIFFIIINTLFLFFRNQFENWKTDTDVLVIGNLVLFLAVVVSFIFFQKSVGPKSPHGIVRMIYAGILTKLIICLIGVFLYVSIARKNVNKPAIIGCMVLYLVYTVMEVAAANKINKQNKNA